MRTSLRLLLAASKPGALIAAALMYTIGNGIADFLGAPIDWLAFWIGLSCCLLLMFSMHLLDIFFRSEQGAGSIPLYRSLTEINSSLTPIQFRRLVLQIVVTTLTIGAVLTVLLLAQQIIGVASVIILAIMFFLAIAYAVPPMSFARKGLGEVVETILIVNFVSAFGFLLQHGEMHRLLIMLTIPLTCLLLAAYLSLALPGYGEDMVRNHLSMMTVLGWERGMLMHNLLILTAYVLLAAAYLFGLPWRLTWPAVLSMPMGLYQILQMRQIALGVKPNWGILKLTSISLFGLTAYFILISLWIG